MRASEEALTETEREVIDGPWSAERSAEADSVPRRARGFKLPDQAKLKPTCSWAAALEQVVMSVEEAERVVKVQREKSLGKVRKPGGTRRASNTWLVQQIMEYVTIHGPVKRMEMTKALGYTALQLKVVIKELIDQKRLVYVNSSKASKFIKIQLGPGQGGGYVSNDPILGGHQPHDSSLARESD